jgi:CarD family transcriptional regulator
MVMEPSFHVGDKAYYPVHGVAEVVALESRDIRGHVTPVYVLRILESGLKIMVPKANATAVGLREIMSDDDVASIYDILRSTDKASDNQPWNRRHREYMDKIKTGDAFEIAEVLRDLCVLRNQKELSFGERRVLETARNLLVREIAQARHQTEEDIAREIERIFRPAA